MNQYELMYIVPTTLTEEAVGAVETTMAAGLEKHGATIQSTTRLGKLRFAYPVNGERHGHYVLVRFTAEPTAITQINDTIRLTMDKVLRHIILTAEEAGDEKFDLVQFQEVNVDTKDDRARRTARAKADAAKKGQDEDQKAAVATIEGAAADAVEPAAEILSSEELQKKIDAALSENA